MYRKEPPFIKPQAYSACIYKGAVQGYIIMTTRLVVCTMHLFQCSKISGRMIIRTFVLLVILVNVATVFIVSIMAAVIMHVDFEGEVSTVRLVFL